MVRGRENLGFELLIFAQNFHVPLEVSALLQLWHIFNKFAPLLNVSTKYLAALRIASAQRPSIASNAVLLDGEGILFFFLVELFEEVLSHRLIFSLLALRRRVGPTYTFAHAQNSSLVPIRYRALHWRRHRHGADLLMDHWHPSPLTTVVTERVFQ